MVIAMVIAIINIYNMLKLFYNYSHLNMEFSLHSFVKCQIKKLNSYINIFLLSSLFFNIFTYFIFEKKLCIILLLL